MIDFNEIPRRNRIELLSPAELAIFQAVQAVEEVGSHPTLTEAVILLGQAREKMADYVDMNHGDLPLDLVVSPEPGHTAV